MRTYGLFPVGNIGNDPLVDAEYLDLAANLICDSLRLEGDNFHYCVDWKDPKSVENTIFFNEKNAVPHVEQIQDEGKLYHRIRASLDPNGEVYGGVIRSIATCRAVAFGYDGQAFLCLRHEDTRPKTPNETLLLITEENNFAYEYDYFDGFSREL